MGEKIYATEPAAAGALEEYGNHIVQYSPEYSLCTGCETCSILCGLSHEGFTGPGNSRIRIDLGTRSIDFVELMTRFWASSPKAFLIAFVSKRSL